MRLSYRAALTEDFDAFYRAFFDKDLDNMALRAAVESEWQVLLSNSTTMTMLVEDEARTTESLVACGQAVFISEEFARLACAGLPPWLNAHITKPLPDGTSPLLTSEEV